MTRPPHSRPVAVAAARASPKSGTPTASTDPRALEPRAERRLGVAPRRLGVERAHAVARDALAREARAARGARVGARAGAQRRSAASSANAPGPAREPRRERAESPQPRVLGLVGVLVRAGVVVVGARGAARAGRGSISALPCCATRRALRARGAPARRR